MIKSQMYGRVYPDLLCKRILGRLTRVTLTKSKSVPEPLSVVDIRQMSETADPARLGEQVQIEGCHGSPRSGARLGLVSG